MDDDDAARARVATTLYTAAEGLRVLAVALNPVMPKASASLWEQLGAAAALGDLADQPIAEAGRWGQLPAGVVLTKGASLFPRLEDPAA
jgi:methionyl-tRNA synthetase